MRGRPGTTGDGVGLPRVRAVADHGLVTLGQLRTLVQVADGMSDDLVVRGNMVPFKLADLGNPLGGSIQALALDLPENA